MNIENLFVTASREAYRFDSKLGAASLTVEQLWHLPLSSTTKASLDNVAIELNRQLKGTEESFVSAVTAKDTTLSNKLEIVKYVIQTRMAENTAKLEAAARKQQRARIDELIQRKQDEKLENLTLEQLEALKENI